MEVPDFQKNNSGSTESSWLKFTCPAEGYIKHIADNNLIPVSQRIKHPESRSALFTLFCSPFILWGALNLVWLEIPSHLEGADPPPTMPAFPNNSDSWILVDLPPDATQLEYGAEIYRLVCSPCHAYDGTGLTEDWRNTWNPEDQNCWQSKCHGYNHPSDGFYLPYSPPVVGPIIPVLFESAYDLYRYNYETMPWHNPRSMNENEVLAVTGFILQLNQIDPGQNLTLETAKNIQLRPQSVQIAKTPAYTPSPRITSAPEQEYIAEPDNKIPPAGTWLVGGIGLGIFLFAAVVMYCLSKNKPTTYRLK